MGKRIIAALFLILIQSACSALNPALNPDVIGPGRCFTVSMTLEPAVKAKASFLGRSVNFYEGRAIIGVPPEQKPGKYLLAVTVIKNDGTAEKIDKEITVTRYRFPFVSFWLKPSKKKLFTKDLIAEEWARIEKVLTVEPAQKAWADRFLLPAKGPASMVFGTVERVNGKPSGRHRGLDIAVPLGTKIKAPNHGRVVFAEHLKAFGGTIVLDHGQGVHTLYFHLSKFLAKAGQDVSKGDIIALSGNSGISSGPHLHWGMSVHNLRVDPVQWTKHAF